MDSPTGDILQPPTHELLLTILGDYLLHDEDSIWSGKLVTLLGDLDVSAPTARMALSRLHAGQLVVRAHEGRRTMYRLAPRGRSLIAEGRDEIFGFGRHPAWDGSWTLLAYSLTEEQRSLRHVLRRRLRFLGFTGVYTSTWVAPRDREAQLQRLIAELGIEDQCEIFVGVPSNVDRLARDIRERWSVEHLQSAYRSFLDEFSPLSGDQVGDDREKFVARTRMMQHYRQFPLVDPDLPTELCEESKERDLAVNLFHKCWHELKDGATRYVYDDGD